MSTVLEDGKTGFPFPPPPIGSEYEIRKITTLITLQADSPVKTSPEVDKKQRYDWG